MNISETYLAESDAARIAGISLRTLRSFIELDSLASRQTTLGETEVSAHSLAELFKVDIPVVNAADPLGSVIKGATDIYTREPETSHLIDAAPSRETKDPEATETRIQNSHLISLLEKLVEQKDRQVEELRKERDWLRNRIERFEEKQERDQMLLLSETQVMRQLVSKLDRPSPIQRMLSWLGVEQAESARVVSSKPSIEIKSETAENK